MTDTDRSDPDLTTAAEAPAAKAGAGGSTLILTDSDLAHDRDTPAPAVRLAGHYQVADTLGRGGMGEVVLAHDERIGRGVALKRMHHAHDNPAAVARFLREAKVQARLEHPSIVPVHELGRDADGRPYFTMKRIAGTSLWKLTQDKTTTLQRLLRVFVDVCNAIGFAHARGVVHRDVKPSNIMAGEFGEVYVLDWGIARVVDVETPEAFTPSPEDGEALTQVGVTVGTPGYMAPEQARGDTVGPPADVYALGAVLFEILTRGKLHPGSGPDAVATTLEKPTQSPIARVPSGAIPPELEAACVAALAAEPEARPTARELGARVQRYLDGDRDLARRRTLAAEHLADARAAIESGDPLRRGAAMAAAGRSLALDPESHEAAALVSTLMLEPPAVPPPGLVAQLEATDRALVMRQRHAASLSIASYFAFLPMLAWMGVTDWPVVAVMFGLVCIVIVGARVAIARKSTRMMFALVTHAALIAMLSRVVSPFVLVPALASVAAMALIASPPLTDRKWLVIAIMAATVAVPFVLERAGATSTTLAVESGRLVIGSGLVHLDGAAATVFLLAANIAVIAASGWFAWSLAATRRDAMRRAESQAWHLSQLLPNSSLSNSASTAA